MLRHTTPRHARRLVEVVRRLVEVVGEPPEAVGVAGLAHHRAHENLDRANVGVGLGVLASGEQVQAELADQLVLRDRCLRIGGETHDKLSCLQQL